VSREYIEQSLQLSVVVVVFAHERDRDKEHQAKINMDISYAPSSVLPLTMSRILTLTPDAGLIFCSVESYVCCHS
jgi:hypothetical protein